MSTTPARPATSESEEELKQRVVTIQDRTAGLLRAPKTALVEAIDAINAAMAAGATDEELADARSLHRKASMRWDFVASENSTGFHSPQESARILANAIDYARQAQLEAERITSKAKNGKALRRGRIDKSSPSLTPAPLPAEGAGFFSAYPRRSSRGRERAGAPVARGPRRPGRPAAIR